MQKVCVSHDVKSGSAAAVRQAVRQLPIYSDYLDKPMDFGNRSDEDRPRTRMETGKDRTVLAPNDALMVREMAA